MWLQMLNSALKKNLNEQITFLHNIIVCKATWWNTVVDSYHKLIYKWNIFLKGDLVACGILSGNRNFEGRIHPLTRANYLASPPLVIAYALAGRVDIDFETEPLGECNSNDIVQYCFY